MTLTQDKYIPVETDKNVDFNDEGFEINVLDPFLEQDLGIIISTFEKDCQNWAEEDYSQVYLYRDVYGTENFSHRAREQMDYYPGMHQTSNPPEDDPLYTNAKEESNKRINFWNSALDNPKAFMSGLESRREDFDYDKIFGSEGNKKTKAENLGKMLTECIPCLDRLFDMDALLPDGDLLEIHAMNIKVRTDILEKTAALFRDPGMYIDVCSLLKLFSSLCPQDILSIKVLLTQYLAKLNLEVNFNLDFVIQLVGPILSPFLDQMSSWLDKWIQVLLNPQICVLDHINETILIAQQAKIPLSEVGANIGLQTNASGPMHKNLSSNERIAASMGFGDSEKYIFEDGRDAYAGAWGEYNVEQFNTPEEEKYNPNKPEVPMEETELAFKEIADAWSPSYSAEDRTERDIRWAELKRKQKQRQAEVPPPLEKAHRDGTRWSKDKIPNSEKYTSGGEFEAGYYPPERYRSTKPASEYFVSTPIVQSLVETRNIVQGAIQYIQDWFEYITQMVYDLIGTDIGWMSKKTDTTVLKSRIVQLIYMIDAIIESISDNGLECGINSNFDEGQLKFILQNKMNDMITGNRQFEVKDDGSIVLTYKKQAKVTDNSAKSDTNAQKISNTGTPSDTITAEPIEQSSVVIRDCFKSVSKEELDKAKQWIAEFQNKGAIDNG